MSSQTLQIAHLSDTHSRIKPHEGSLEALDGKSVEYGGYPLIISALRDLKRKASQEGKAFLALHSGDTFQGTRHFESFPGLINAEMLNLMALDAMALGNHEFDKGPDCFARFCQLVNFPIIAGNLKIGDKANPKLLDCDRAGKMITASCAETSLVFKMRDEIPLAVVGVTLEDLSDLADTGSDISVINPVEYLRDIARKLNERGIERIIVLSHLGLDQDFELAEEVSNVSAILGGHTHDLMGRIDSFGYEKIEPYDHRVKGIPILHCGENGSHIGSYSLIFDDQCKVVESHCETVAAVNKSRLSDEQLHALKGTQDIILVDPDTTAEQLLDQKFVLDGVNEQSPLIISRSLPHVRVPEQGMKGELAQLIVDSLFRQITELGHDIDLAVLNAGVLRRGIDAGSYADPDALLAELVPFDLDMITFSIWGADLNRSLLRAREQSQISSRSGRYPYLAPVEISFDEKRTYSVVTTSYIASGKDGFTEFSENSRERQTSPIKLRDICKNCLYNLADPSTSIQMRQ